MDRKKLPPKGLRTQTDYERKLWSEVVSLHTAIGARLNGKSGLYETARLAEQMARRLGRLDALRTQARSYELTVNREAD